MQSAITKKKKTGRPKKTIKKEVRACVRFTQAEYAIIREKAIQAGLKAAPYLRLMANQSPFRSRLSEEQMQILRKLVGMSNNINQIAKICHQEGYRKAFVKFEEIRRDLDTILKMFR
jgi:hypothetical protein